MRTLLSAAALSVAVSLGAADVGAAQVPAQDSVTGTAQQCSLPGSCELFTTTLTADARSGPAGENPSGNMIWRERIRTGGSLLETSNTRVSCLSVTDNVAIVGVVGTRDFFGSFGTITVPIAGLVRVTDGGGPDSGLDTVEFDIDQSPFPPLPPLPPPPVAPTDCSAFPAGAGALTNEEGDLVVHDAAPLPTSKDQCKNGGWRSYGTLFKNQGQCVAFVRHQARQACVFERVAHGRAAFRAKYGQGHRKRHAMRSCIRLRVNS